MLASTPHVVTGSRDALATIAVQGNRTLSEHEWGQLERGLTTEALCENLPKELTSRLMMPPEQAVLKTKVP